MRPLDELIAVAVGRLPADLLGAMVAFGSAPLAQDHVRVRVGINDLDLFVSDATFDELQRRGLTSRVKLRDATTHEDVHHIVVAGHDDDPDVEVLKTFPGVRFDEVLAKSSAHPSGLRIGAISDVRTWKLASGRQKDLDDVAAIDRFLARARG